MVEYVCRYSTTCDSPGRPLLQSWVDCLWDNTCFLLPFWLAAAAPGEVDGHPPPSIASPASLECVFYILPLKRTLKYTLHYSPFIITHSKIIYLTRPMHLSCAFHCMFDAQLHHHVFHVQPPLYLIYMYAIVFLYDK